MYVKLESLRGIAACFVVLFHSPLSYFEHRVWFIANSYLFVDLFFILSGFVISYAYTDKISNGLSLKTFAALRLGRIYPLHIFMLLLFVFYTAIKVLLSSLGFGGEQEFDKNNVSSFISNILLIHSIGVHNYLTWNYPSWSISVEFFTYMIFFVLIRSFDKQSTLIFPIILAVAGYCWLSFLERDNLDITYDYGLVRCISAFYIGVFLYRAKEKIRFLEKYPNFWEIFSFSFVALAVSYAHNGWLFQLLAIISFLVTISVFSQSSNGVIGHLLHKKIVRLVGIWSFSIYMIHALIISIAGSFGKYIIGAELSEIHGPMSLIIDLSLLAIIIFISRFTYHFIEDKYRRVVKEKIHRG